MSESKWTKIKHELRNAFALRVADYKLSEEEGALLDKIATAIAKRGMAIPALMFLETIKPLNLVGSQVMAFFEPFADTLMKGNSFMVFRSLMEDRRNVLELMARIERKDRELAERQRQEPASSQKE